MARSPVKQTTGEQQQAGSEPSSFRANKEIDSEAIHKLSQIQVSQYESLVPSLIKYFKHNVANFKAGQLSTSYFAWKELTSDPEILETVSGQRIEFNQNPVQLNLPVQPNYSYQQGQFIDSEIQNLLKKGVIVESTHEPSEYISPIFLRPKKDGSHRMILNLKCLNQSVTFQHFKMDTIWTAIRMRPGCFMASIDLKDAYYSVPIHKDHQKYLKFQWRGKLYQYTCFPNGLAICPRKFTKLLKPVFSNLRSIGHLSVIFIDDSYLQGADFNLCVKNVKDTITLLDQVGLVIHPEKSVLYPTQKLVFLGFLLDSIKMIISLTGEKTQKIKEACQKLLQSPQPTIREVARVIGMLTASFPGVMFGPLHYSHLDMDKTVALKLRKGNYNKTMTLSDEAKHELSWWVSSIESAYNVVSHGQADTTMTTDASKTGWGCSLAGIPTGGSWDPGESEKHINWLEVKAILLSLKSFVDHICQKHVKILSDNTTAVCCINHMGTSHSKEINLLVTEIWDFCIKNNIWITVAHIPGKHNVIADFESRRGINDTEWALDQTVYDQAIQLLDVTPSIDLFASRLNYKCKPYVAFRPDPEAQAINAFHISWVNMCFYAFPPFCIIN